MPPAEIVALRIRCGRDNSGHQRAVCIAIRGAVPGEDIVTAGNHLGQPSMARNAGVDDRDPLAGAAGESPDLVEVGELSGPLSPAESPSRFGGDLGAYLTLYGRLRRRRQRRFG